MTNMTHTILAWAFIFAVPLFAFVYAWFVMEQDRYDTSRDFCRFGTVMLCLFVFVGFGMWLLNLPA